MKPPPSVHPSQFPMPVSHSLSLPVSLVGDAARLTAEIHATHVAPGPSGKAASGRSLGLCPHLDYTAP